jgi:hypothetical protein
MSVHATFTEYGDAGKRWRMLEAGLWAVVEPEYFSQGNFLTFELPAPPPDPAPCDGASHAGERVGHRSISQLLPSLPLASENALQVCWLDIQLPPSPMGA